MIDPLKLSKLITVLGAVLFVSSLLWLLLVPVEVCPHGSRVQVPLQSITQGLMILGAMASLIGLLTSGLLWGIRSELREMRSELREMRSELREMRSELREMRSELREMRDEMRQGFDRMISLQQQMLELQRQSLEILARIEQRLAGSSGAGERA